MAPASFLDASTRQYHGAEKVYLMKVGIPSLCTVQTGFFPVASKKDLQNSNKIHYRARTSGTSWPFDLLSELTEKYLQEN